jgi:hypothetical protein
MARQSFPDEADPVPQFLDQTVGAPTAKPYALIMDDVMLEDSVAIGRRSLRSRHNRRPSRYSDSGPRSSIGSKSGKNDAVGPASEHRCTKSIVAASAITKSAAAHSSTIKSY